jgi:hypothetical protein
MVLRLRIPAPDNWQGAKCHLVDVARDYDPFFDEPDEHNPDPASEAVEFCNGTADGQVCPLRDACLTFALTNNEKRGVWGGATPLTRRLIRRQWPLRRGKDPRPEWHWMTEADAIALHSPDDAAAIAAEPDEDDEEEEWVA